ncbi:MAG TPA: galactose-1-phosphate uridylyltransferase [Ktedonobacterales bacterium]|nr:galactose-1-phosphate uridylyltransferase [Ktedonobacterales bacterium]
MSQLRWDPTLSEWVIYAPWRQDRTFLPPVTWCPLCPTRDERFPTEVPFSSYEIVVFENRFPSLSLSAPTPDDAEAHLALDAHDTQEATLAGTRPGYGVCEVVLYTDEHTTTLAQLSEERIRQLIEVWADRYIELGGIPDVRYVFIFENKGEVIGVTLQHPHGQIYAYPFIPPRPARELAAARAYADTHSGSCLHCAILAQELADGRRIVVRGDSFTTFVPYYAHYPYEVHIYANRCISSIAQLTAAEQRDLAVVLKQTLSAYDALWGFSLPYVMGIHQAPTIGEDHTGIAHLHFEFYPPHRTRDRLKYLAGSELGAGSFIVDVLPEAAAATLREAAIRSRERAPR